MDVAKLIERFTTIHGPRPESKHELESWFAKYASRPDGWILICHLALDDHDRKGWRTGLVRQMQTQYRDVYGRGGSPVQIEKWMFEICSCADGMREIYDRRKITGSHLNMVARFCGHWRRTNEGGVLGVVRICHFRSITSCR